MCIPGLWMVVAGCGPHATHTMQTKSILLSKTFWLQILAFAAVLFPAVQAWLAANPVQAVGALAAANIIVRFVTSGHISIFAGAPAEADAGSSRGVYPAIIGCIAAAGIMGCLPSCTGPQLAQSLQALRAIPIRSCVATDYGTACYSSKRGLDITVDATSGK